MISLKIAIFLKCYISLIVMIPALIWFKTYVNYVRFSIYIGITISTCIKPVQILLHM